MKTRVFLFTALLLLAGATLFAPIYMNYLKIDGVAGDSKAPGYQGWLDAASLSFAPAAAVVGQPVAKCSTHEIIIVKRIDKSSPKLSQFCASGKHFPAVTVSINGERHLLQDAVVKSIQDTAMADGSVREVMTLDFAHCATHESSLTPSTSDKWLKIDNAAGNALKAAAPNAILIGLTPRPEAAALIGLLFNGDGHSARLMRKAGGSQQDIFRQALQSRQVIPQLTLTLNNGQKWTFTNVTVAGITDGTSKATQSVSLSFSKFDGSPAGFQDLH